MRKIGIVGGGLAGLTCAYRLAQQGQEVAVLEKDSIAGGRIQFAAVIGTEKFQSHVVGLVKDLGLEEMQTILKPEEIAFWGDDFLALTDFPGVLKKSLSEGELNAFAEFSKFVNSLNFDPLSPSQELIDLRSISLAEYGKKFSENVQNFALVAAKILSEEDDLGKIGADYGLHLVRMGNEVMSGEAICFEEVNLMSLTNVLSKEIEKQGGKILRNHEVKNVTGKDGHFEINHESLGERFAEEVNVVVFALPLVHVNRIFPELNLQTNIEYPKNKIIISDGELKYPKVKLLMGLPGNPHNLRLFLSFIPKEQYFLPWKMDKKVDLSFLYQKHQIISEKEIFPLPWIPPDPQVPELKSKMDGVYLVGDFYYYPYDTSVHTGEAVAEMILKG